MKSFMKKLVAVLSVVAAVFAVSALVLVLCGFRPLVLESPSMEPLYRVGSLCWVNTRVDFSDLQIGDVLVYRSPANSLVMHRLISVQSSSGDEIVVEMQGDTNPTVQEVTLSRINFVGKEAFTIPRLGTLVSSASGVFPVLVVLLIILACLPRLPRLSRLLHKKETKAGDPA